MGAETRAFLTEVFTAWADRQDVAPFVAALADDLTWTVTGTSPISGTYTSREEYVEQVLRPLTDRLVALPTLQVVRMVVDGDWAAVHLRGEGTGKRGENYDMDYCWLLRVVDRRIHQVIGFYDSVKVDALFAP